MALVLVEGAAPARRATAARDAARGELAACEPAPVTPVLRLELWDERCALCLIRLPGDGDGGRCGKCRAVRYCSRDHQRVAWKDHHRAECAALHAMLAAVGPEVGEDAVLLGRVLRRPAALAAVEALELQPREDLAAERAAAGVVRLLGLDIAPRRAADALKRFRNNNFAVVDDLYVAVAAGVFPGGAMLNHSCRPNCVLAYSFDGARTRQSIRLLRPVRAGEELTHAYCDSVWPRARRQAWLAETYGFRCGCPGCATPDAALERLLEEGSQPPPPGAAAVKRMVAAWASGDCDARLVSTCGAALTFALEERDFALAARCSESLVAMYKSVYGDFHPLVGLQLHTLADLACATGCKSPDEQRELIASAAAVLRVTQAEGASSPLVQGLNERLAHAAA